MLSSVLQHVSINFYQLKPTGFRFCIVYRALYRIVLLAFLFFFVFRMRAHYARIKHIDVDCVCDVYLFAD